jgi:hypothetical protein
MLLQCEQKLHNATLSKEPQPKCTFCGNKIEHPNLEYQIGKKNYRAKNKDITVDEGRVKFYSA